MKITWAEHVHDEKNAYIISADTEGKSPLEIDSDRRIN